MKRHILKTIWGLLALSIVIIPFLTSCDSWPIHEEEDTSDPCSAERQDLSNYKADFVEDVVMGTIGGSIGEAATKTVDFLTHGGSVSDAKDEAKKAAIIGGIKGGINGYYTDLQRRQGKMPKDFFTNLVTDIDAENARVTEMNSSFDQLVSCRQTQLANIRTAYKRNETNRTASEQLLTDLHRMVRMDLKVANDIRKGLGDRAKKLEYVVIRADTDVEDDDQDPDQTDDNQDQDNDNQDQDNNNQDQPKNKDRSHKRKHKTNDSTSYNYSSPWDGYYLANTQDEFGGQLLQVRHDEDDNADDSSKRHHKKKHKKRHGKTKHNDEPEHSTKKTGFHARLAQSHSMFQHQYEHCKSNWSALSALQRAPLEGGMEMSVPATNNLKSSGFLICAFNQGGSLANDSIFAPKGDRNI